MSDEEEMLLRAFSSPSSGPASCGAAQRGGCMCTGKCYGIPSPLDNRPQPFVDHRTHPPQTIPQQPFPPVLPQNKPPTDMNAMMLQEMRFLMAEFRALTAELRLMRMQEKNADGEAANPSPVQN